MNAEAKWGLPIRLVWTSAVGGETEGEGYITGIAGSSHLRPAATVTEGQ